MTSMHFYDENNKLVQTEDGKGWAVKGWEEDVVFPTIQQAIIQEKEDRDPNLEGPLPSKVTVVEYITEDHKPFCDHFVYYQMERVYEELNDEFTHEALPIKNPSENVKQKAQELADLIKEDFQPTLMVPSSREFVVNVNDYLMG